LDSQIVPLLQEIRSTLWILVVFVASFWIVKLIKAARATVMRTKKRFDDRFKIIAANMFDRGQFFELLNFCDAQLKNRPNDALAY
jgi:hypothetical protein